MAADDINMMDEEVQNSFIQQQAGMSWATSVERSGFQMKRGKSLKTEDS